MPKLSALPLKAVPTTADEITITDKADSNNTKRTTINNLPLSAAAVSALATKAPTASPTFTGNINFPSGIINSSGNLLVGKTVTNNPAVAGHQFFPNGVAYHTADGAGALLLNRNTNDGNLIIFRQDNIEEGTISVSGTQLQVNGRGSLGLQTGGVTRATIDGSGNLLVGKTASNFATQGAEIFNNGTVNCTRSAAACINVNRLTDDGDLVGFYQAGTKEGSISVSGTQIRLNGSGSLGLQTGGTTRATIDASGNLGVGTSSPQEKASINGFLELVGTHTTATATNNPKISRVDTSNALGFFNGGSEKMRLDSSGNFMVGKTTIGLTNLGLESHASGLFRCTRSANQPLEINRKSDDGTLVAFFQDNIFEGSISVSGTTVSYNGGHLARWSRMLDGSKPENLLKGTVMSNLDDMIEWAYDETPEVLWAAGDGLPEGVSVGDVKVEGVEATYWGEGDELPEGVEVGDVKTEAVEEVLWGETDGLPEGVSIGDVKVEYKAAGTEDNEQLNHTAISSVEGDRDVAGVFIAWDDDDDYNDYHLAMAGDVIIRIAEGVEVKRGDLLISAGDGTAKPLDPEAPLTVGLQAAIVAKVTSTVVSCTYDDGSFCVPCVLK